MKKSDFRGMGKVFKFTFLQMFKSKSFIIGMVLMLLFAIGLFPVYAIINREDKESKSDIKNLYVINESGISSLNYDELLAKDKNYAEINIAETTESTEDLEKKISKKHSNDVILKIGFDQTTFSYSLDLSFDDKSEISFLDVDEFSSDVKEWFDEQKIAATGADADVIATIRKDIKVDVRDTEDYLGDKDAEIISSDDYNIVYAVIMVLYFIVLFTSNVVATKIVEEKANRIVEYLMTNIRPMALIAGKVLAGTLAVTIELGSVLVFGLISKTVTSKITGNDFKNIAGGFSGRIISMVSAPKLLLVIVIIALGIMLYSFLAGLFGATVTKMEEVQQGMKVYTMILVISFLVAIVASNLMWTMGINSFVKFTFYFPFTSAMMLPGAIFIGKASMVTIIVSIALMVAVTLFLVYFIALVYEALIVNNSGVVSLKQMIALATSARRASKNKNKGGAADEEK
ncbi:MAG: ABC transporter permease [Lachnospiraceae bacterium]|nr:ABC transporter permease [Lachnospiraceae bacterium]